MLDETSLGACAAGDVLTFELYTDRDCTALVHTQVEDAQDVRLVSRLRLLTVRGATTPPHTAELRLTLTGVPPAAPLYAKIVGPHIVPVGGACQVQTPDGPPRPAGHTLVLEDANGQILGPWDNEFLRVSVMTPNGPAQLSVGGPNGFDDGWAFYYTSGDCTGSPLVIANETFPFVNGVLRNSTLYYAPRTGHPMTLGSRAYGPSTAATCYSGPYFFVPPDACCCTIANCPQYGSYDYAEPQALDLSTFVPPFHLGFE